MSNTTLNRPWLSYDHGTRDDVLKNCTRITFCDGSQADRPARDRPWIVFGARNWVFNEARQFVLAQGEVPAAPAAPEPAETTMLPTTTTLDKPWRDYSEQVRADVLQIYLRIVFFDGSAVARPDLHSPWFLDELADDRKGGSSEATGFVLAQGAVFPVGPDRSPLVAVLDTPWGELSATMQLFALANHLAIKFCDSTAVERDAVGERWRRRSSMLIPSVTDQATQFLQRYQPDAQLLFPHVTPTQHEFDVLNDEMVALNKSWADLHYNNQQYILSKALVVKFLDSSVAERSRGGNWRVARAIVPWDNCEARRFVNEHGRNGTAHAPPAQLAQPAAPERVNHPAHYGGDTTYEVIKVIEAWDLGFALGNAVKYIGRAGKKDPAKRLEDLEKARWYLDRYIAALRATAQ